MLLLVQSARTVIEVVVVLEAMLILAQAISIRIVVVGSTLVAVIATVARMIERG